LVEKILVVDDSASDRLIIQKMLEDYNTLTASDGNEALNQINEHNDIVLIILDLHMPNMDGFQVLAKLNSDNRYKSLRTIILTNYDELDNEIKGLKLGAVDFIRKPVHMEALKVRVDVQVKLLRIQQLLEQKLHDQGLTFDIIFNQAPLGISICLGKEPLPIENMHKLSVNPKFEEITGRTEAELIKLGWEKITHPDDLEEDLENYWKLQAGEIKSYAMDKRYIKPDGSIVWVYMVVASLDLYLDNQFNHICLVQDITKRKNVEENLIYNLEHDQWTGLYNKNYLENLLKNDIMMQDKVKSALVGINFSQLHSLNLVYGYQYTRDLIRTIVDSLKKFCSDERMLFNMYELQYAFYIKAYREKKDLEVFCEALVEALDSLLTIERIDAGIGIVEIEDNAELNADQLFKKMLIASEKVIDGSGNTAYCFFDDNMEAEIVRKDEIKRVLTRLAAGDVSESLFLQYQPILELKTNKVKGFEALARIKSNQFGLISPHEFIPIAEETKLIIPLGDKIILQAFYFMKKLSDNGYSSLCFSINISAIQLLRKGFCQYIFDLIREMNIDPENICLEITESLLADDYDEINKILGELKSLGIKIALDDFGTGYSSLAREHELNIDILKIDKIFMDKLLTLKPDEAITGDIISMAHKLGHRVIAEGVEEEKQRRYLEDSSCDMIQGFLISKPLDEELAIEIIRNSSFA